MSEANTSRHIHIVCDDFKKYVLLSTNQLSILIIGQYSYRLNIVGELFSSFINYNDNTPVIKSQILDGYIQCVKYKNSQNKILIEISNWGALNIISLFDELYYQVLSASDVDLNQWTLI